ncbi:hypothetical protein [Sphingobacterium gobiense]|uniref:Response regulatory domain-containing protein n=1 Tax=Sphingobacterium gobiense TaxID=1382456 RepID=A0A2S9JVL8_9SPHI|nr:hypothetical protein [Sphingobacterium gobiense]PRD57181.1 hypothetical protein C5749_08255 [Sphingobacterium gobiense]
MKRITVGIVSNNKRLRIAYRLLLEEEGDGEMEVLWDSLLGEDLGLCQTRYEQPDVLLIDYEGWCNQASFSLEDLKNLFPESAFLLICDDCEKNLSKEERGVKLRQFLISKYCSVQTLLSSISQVVLSAMLSKRKPSRGFA